MLKSGRIYSVGLAFVLVFALVLGVSGNVFAQEAKLIKIHGVGGDTLQGIFIDPETAYIKKNAIVVWLDGVVQEDIKIEFADGKKCKSVTAYQSNFELLDLTQERWCFVSSWVSFAGTSSLQFTEAGTYEYKVVNKDGKISANATLVVE